MKNQDLTTIYIVRHGETVWNIKGLFQGHKDSPLTEKGKIQAKSLAKELKKIHFDLVYSSDLLRAKRTAEIIALERKIAVKTSEALREKSFGRYDGKSIMKVRQNLKDLYHQYERLSNDKKKLFKFSNDSESEEESTTRLITFLRELAVAYPGKSILIVTHGGIMRYFLIHLGFGTYQSLPANTISNTAYIKLESDGIDFLIKETKGVNKRA